MNAKILALDELANRSRQLRENGQQLVLTNGCFDLLHVGHVRYLASARALGDALAVAVNGDASVRELKGAGRPINSESDRAEILAALAAVDYVTIFPEPRATRVIAAVQPAIYAKGGDYTVETLHPEERAALEAAGTSVHILPIVPGRSTSRLVETLAAK